MELRDQVASECLSDYPAEAAADICSHALQPRLSPAVAQPAWRSCSFFFSCRYLIPHGSEVICACGISHVVFCHVMMKFVCGSLSKALNCLACC